MAKLHVTRNDGTYPFTVLTLLTGLQEEHPSCEKVTAIIHKMLFHNGPNPTQPGVVTLEMKGCQNKKKQKS